MLCAPVLVARNGVPHEGGDRCRGDQTDPSGTLADLARQLDMDAEALSATVARFNAMAVRGVDEDLQRGTTAYQHNIGDPASSGPNPNLGALSEAPFFAVRLYPGDIGSATGLATDTHARVLDVGCGGGILSDSMARKGADVLGIDLASKALRVAQLHALEAGTTGVQYREVSAEALALEQPGQFDVVTCMEMLEHVPDPSSVIRACSAMARPGGWVFFSTLNRNPKSFLFAIVGAEYVLKLLPKGTHEYARFIRPSELVAWCRDAGLEATATRGLEYNPITRRYWLSADTSVNYLIACRKPA